MKLLLLVLYLFSWASIYAQKEDAFDCVLIKKTAETKIFEKQFMPCQLDTVILIDLNADFKQCPNLHICGKDIVLKQPDSNKKEYENELHNIGKIFQNHIFIYRVDKNKNMYSLYLKQSYSGASINVNLRYNKKRKIIKVVSYNYGAF